MNFGGRISYKDPKRTTKHLFFNHTLNISDILRPLVMNTEEYGQKWTEASFEKKQRLSSSFKNCQDISKTAEEQLRLHMVEQIGEKYSFKAPLQTHAGRIWKRKFHSENASDVKFFPVFGLSSFASSLHISLNLDPKTFIFLSTRIWSVLQQSTIGPRTQQFTEIPLWPAKRLFSGGSFCIWLHIIIDNSGSYYRISSSLNDTVLFLPRYKTYIGWYRDAVWDMSVAHQL